MIKEKGPKGVSSQVQGETYASTARDATTSRRSSPC